MLDNERQHIMSKNFRIISQNLRKSRDALADMINNMPDNDVHILLLQEVPITVNGGLTVGIYVLIELSPQAYMYAVGSYRTDSLQVCLSPAGYRDTLDTATYSWCDTRPGGTNNANTNDGQPLDNHTTEQPPGQQVPNPHGYPHSLKHSHWELGGDSYARR